MKNLIPLLALAVSAQAYHFEEDLLFYASFDKSATADFSRGNPQPTAVGEGRIVAGRQGQGWDLRTGFIEYLSKGNIDQAAGTIAFWFKPHWQPDGNISRHFLSWADSASGGSLNSLFLYYRPQQNQLQLLVAPGTKAANMDFARFEPSWNAETWHHLAATWQYPELNIYLDGVLVAKGTLRGSIAVGPPRFLIGAYMNRTSPANAVFDEFYIYRRALSEQEISIVGRLFPEPRMTEAKPLQTAFIAPARHVPYQVLLKGELTSRHTLRLKVGNLAPVEVPWSDSVFFVLPSSPPPGTYQAVVSLMDGTRELSRVTNELHWIGRPGD